MCLKPNIGIKWLNRYVVNISSKSHGIHIFPSAHETLSMIDHILGYKTGLNKFKMLKSHKVCSLNIMELNQNSITEGSMRNSQLCGN